MSLLQRSAQIYPLLEHQALRQLFTSGEFTFVEESRDRSWHGIYTCPLLRCLNFLDFKFCTFDSVKRSKQRPLVHVCRDKQGIDSSLLSPPSPHYVANVENLPGFRAGMQTHLKILRSFVKLNHSGALGTWMPIASWNILDYLRAGRWLFFGATQDGAAHSILRASRSRRDSLHAVPRMSARPAGSSEASRDRRGDSNWLLCWMPHSLCGGWMALGLFQQSNNLKWWLVHFGRELCEMESQFLVFQ